MYSCIHPHMHVYPVDSALQCHGLVDAKWMQSDIAYGSRRCRGMRQLVIS